MKTFFITFYLLTGKGTCGDQRKSTEVGSLLLPSALEGAGSGSQTWQ